MSRRVALTGFDQEEYRRRSTEAGFDHHLVKPAAIDDPLIVIGGFESPAVENAAGEVVGSIEAQVPIIRRDAAG